MNQTATARRFARITGLITALVALLAVTACTGAETPDPPPSPSPRSYDFESRGPVTLVALPSETLEAQIARWNADHADEAITLVELSGNLEEQRQQLVDLANQESAEATMFSMDARWTAEFAASGWIAPLGTRLDVDGLAPAALAAAGFRGELYGVPVTADARLLYYRVDWLKAAGIDAPPQTYAELQAACRTVKETVEAAAEADCYGGQFGHDESLTVSVTEFVHSAGGQLINETGTSVANGQGAINGLTELQQLFTEGTIPEAALDWGQGRSRDAFVNGDLIFVRHWSSMYAAAEDPAEDASAVEGRFGVAPIVGPEGPGVSCVSVRSLSLNAYGENLGTALDVVEFLTSEAELKAGTAATGQPPARPALLTDPELARHYPYLPILQRSLQTAQPRPQAVDYAAVTAAIQDAGDAVLSDGDEPVAALEELHARLQELLTG